MVQRKRPCERLGFTPVAGPDGESSHPIHVRLRALFAGTFVLLGLVSICPKSDKLLIKSVFSRLRRKNPLDFAIVELRHTTGKNKRIPDARDPQCSGKCI